MAIYPAGSIEGIGNTSPLSSGADVIDKDEFIFLFFIIYLNISMVQNIL